MEYTIHNIGDWVADLNTKCAFAQYRVYLSHLFTKQKQETDKAIIEKCGLANKHGTKEVMLITEDLAVVCYTDVKGNSFYIPHVEGKSCYEWFINMEGALIAAVCLQQTGSTDAAKYAAKLLDVPTSQSSLKHVSSV